MANDESNTRSLAKYRNRYRRITLLSPNCNINGIDYIEVCSLNSLLELLPSHTSIEKKKLNVEISEKDDKSIIIVHCFKPIDHSIDKNNIWIEGSNNIIIKFIIKGIDFLKEKNKNHYLELIESKKDNKISDNFFNEALSKLLTKIEHPEKSIIIFLNKINNYSVHTLKLVKDIFNDKKSKMPLEGFDQIFSQIDFRFLYKENNTIMTDCIPQSDKNINHLSTSTTFASIENIEIDYMVKDYASFRKLMLDRINLIAPQWNEQSPADIGMVLVEILAYIGDHLSYYQDAVGTESYLGTCRSRVSLKRHARLFDYEINEGRNSRVWIYIELDSNIENKEDIEKGITILKNTQLTTFEDSNSLSNENTNNIIITNDEDFKYAINNGAQVFETIYDKVLYPQHNNIDFYTWGNSHYVLEKGSTNVTLLNKNKNLKLNSGDILLFEEIISPQSLCSSDADQGRKHVIRINKVQYYEDYLYDSPIPIIDISWGKEDALPFPMTITASKNNSNENLTTDDALLNKNDDNYNSNKDLIVYCSIARANMVLADQGYTVFEILGRTPPPEGKFYPKLSLKPLTNATLNYDYNRKFQILSAKEFIEHDPQSIKPAIQLLEITSVNNVNNYIKTENINLDKSSKKNKGIYFSLEQFKKALENSIDGTKIRIQKWNLCKDIFSLNEFDNGFVTEIEDDGTVNLRFGDGYYGQAPVSSTPQESHIFCAIYRVGNGTNGNVNAESICKIRLNDDSQLKDKIKKIRNPINALNGKDPDSANRIRQYASTVSDPTRKYYKAVTEEDYITILQSHSEIKSAKASIEWTGTLYIVSIIIERFQRQNVDKEFKEKILNFIDGYRLSGYDIKITGCVYVPLYILLKISIYENYFQNETRQRLLQAFGNTRFNNLNSQSKGLFNQDNLHLGQHVFYSRVHETAMSVAGVESVSFLRFQRLGLNIVKNEQEKTMPSIIMADNEIPIIDNDPFYPDNGIIDFIIDGGL